MTRDQAKEYLSAFRAHEADEADPTLRQALELARNDSELGSWLAQQREFDKILIEKFASISPPEGLKETILESLDGTVRPIQSWRMGWLALAATVVLAGLLLSQKVDLFRGSSQMFRSFRSDALAMVSVKPAPILDLETPSLGTTQAFICLAATSSLPYVLPPSLRQIPACSRHSGGRGRKPRFTLWTLLGKWMACDVSEKRRFARDVGHPSPDGRGQGIYRDLSAAIADSK